LTFHHSQPEGLVPDRWDYTNHTYVVGVGGSTLVVRAIPLCKSDSFSARAIT